MYPELSETDWSVVLCYVLALTCIVLGCMVMSRDDILQDLRQQGVEWEYVPPQGARWVVVEVGE